MTDSQHPADALAGVYAQARAIVAGTTADQYDAPTPCSEWNVRELLNHTIGVVHGLASAAAGEAAPEGDAPDFTADDTVAAFDQATARSLAAWRADGVLDSMLQVGPIEMPAQAAIGINMLDTLTHAWDLAVATGQDRSLDPELAEAALGAAQMTISDEIRPGRFGPAVPISDDAPAHDRLAAFLGRTPS